MPEQNIKSHPGIAAVLSFVFNGLGQLYNGQILKGLSIIFLSAVSMLFLIIGSLIIGLWLFNKVIFAGQLAWGVGLFLLAVTSVCILGIYSIIDAYNVAKSSV